MEMTQYYWRYVWLNDAITDVLLFQDCITAIECSLNESNTAVAVAEQRQLLLDLDARLTWPAPVDLQEKSFVPDDCADILTQAQPISLASNPSVGRFELDYNAAKSIAARVDPRKRCFDSRVKRQIIRGGAYSLAL